MSCLSAKKPFFSYNRRKTKNKRKKLHYIEEKNFFDFFDIFSIYRLQSDMIGAIIDFIREARSRQSEKH